MKGNPHADVTLFYMLRYDDDPLSVLRLICMRKSDAMWP
jgi:hypothetical protein